MFLTDCYYFRIPATTVMLQFRLQIASSILDSMAHTQHSLHCKNVVTFQINKKNNPSSFLIRKMINMTIVKIFLKWGLCGQANTQYRTLLNKVFVSLQHKTNETLNYCEICFIIQKNKLNTQGLKPLLQTAQANLKQYIKRYYTYP